MFNIGAGEMVLIAVAALLILGPKRLPELARGLGKFMREFRRQTDEVRNVVEREFYSMDQDIAAPTPPVRPGTAFANTPPPPSVALPEAPLFPPDAALAGTESPVPEAAVPVPPTGTEVLEMDAAGPRPLEPSHLHEPAAAPAEPVALTPDTPVPVPGTVARNAPKRS